MMTINERDLAIVKKHGVHYTKTDPMSYMKEVYAYFVDKYGQTDWGYLKSNDEMKDVFGYAWSKNQEEIWQWYDYDVMKLDMQ